MNVEEQTVDALTLAEIIGNNFFAGRQPGLIGGTLAELMSTYLLNHQCPDDLMKQADLREKILQTWCDTVRQLVALQDKPAGRAN